MLMWIKEKITQLKERYKTDCPYQLAEQLKIQIMQHNLHHEINGYYKYDRRNQYIVINSNLDDYMQRVVCAHELGHAVLHKHTNTPFMRKSTFLSVDKIETEANRFAAELLIEDKVLYECETYQQLASIHNVPVELIRLKSLCREVLK